MRKTLLNTAILAGSIGIGSAQSTWSSGATTQEWANAANWTGGVPGVNSRATINVSTGNTPVITTNVNKTATVGGNDLWLGNGSGTTGRLDISSGGTLTTNGTWVFVGNSGGTGIIHVNSGGTLSTDNDIRFNQGAIHVNSGGTLTAGRIVGTGGTSGQINVSGTGSLTTLGAGTANGSPDLLNVAVSSFSGTISAARNLNFRNGTTSDMSGGSITTGAGGEIRIGNFGTHTFTQSAGSISTGQWMVVGIGAGGDGTYNMSGGSVTSATGTGSTAFTTIGAGGGTGVVNMSGGTWTDVNRTFVGENTGGTGTFNLNGGVLHTGRVETGGGTGNLNFDGGTLRAYRNESNFITANTSVRVEDGGGSIDTNGFNVTTAANIVQDGLSPGGQLEKEGAGSLTLSGTGNSVNSVMVSAGTLLVTGQLGTTAGTTVASGAAIGGTGTLAGDLMVSDGGRIDVSIGALTISAGSTVSFGDFGFDDIVGFDVNSAANGTYTLLEGTFSLNPAGIAHFGESNKLSLGGNRFAWFEEGSLNVIVVPEPGIALLGGFGLLGLLRRRRR